MNQDVVLSHVFVIFHHLKAKGRRLPFYLFVWPTAVCGGPGSGTRQVGTDQAVGNRRILTAQTGVISNDAGVVEDPGDFAAC